MVLSMNNEERRFSARFSVRTFAYLVFDGREWAAHILDLSLTGARLALLDEYHINAGDVIELRLEIPELKVPANVQPFIHLEATLIHQKEHMLGIKHKPKTELDDTLLKQLLTVF